VVSQSLLFKIRRYRTSQIDLGGVGRSEDYVFGEGERAFKRSELIFNNQIPISNTHLHAITKEIQ
jgi:hypothetical protein